MPGFGSGVVPAELAHGNRQTPDAERVAFIRETWARNAQEAQRVFLNAEIYHCAVLPRLPVVSYRQIDETLAPAQISYLEFRKQWHRRNVDEYEWIVTCEDVLVAQGLQPGNTVTITSAGSGYVAQPVNVYTYNQAEAEQKSIDLLKSWLTPRQLKDFEKTSSFTATGNVTCKKYRIERRSTFNVRELNNQNQVVRSLCFVPQGAYTTGDIMLAQKIMLEQREDEALRIANFSTGNPIPTYFETLRRAADLLVDMF